MNVKYSSMGGVGNVYQIYYAGENSVSHHNVQVAYLKNTRQGISFDLFLQIPTLCKQWNVSTQLSILRYKNFPVTLQIVFYNVYV